MRTRTAAALTLLVAGGALGTLTGTAAAAPPEGRGATVTDRAWAAYTGAEELFAEVTVEEVRGSAVTVDLLLSAEGWDCTTDGAGPAVADVERLESARAVATFDYTCTEDDAPQGLVAPTLSGTASVDLAWTGSGGTERLPLYHCNVGRSLVRAATVTGGVVLTGEHELAGELVLAGGGMSHDHLACPPGRAETPQA